MVYVLSFLINCSSFTDFHVKTSHQFYYTCITNSPLPHRSLKLEVIWSKMGTFGEGGYFTKILVTVFST